MEILLIWIRQDDEVWLKGAWDEESAVQNAEGFDAEVQGCYRKYGAEHVRVQQASVPWNSIYLLFNQPSVELIPREND